MKNILTVVVFLFVCFLLIIGMIDWLIMRHDRQSGIQSLSPAPPAATNEISSDPFVVRKSKTLGVRFHGATLIEKDSLVSLNSMEEEGVILRSGTKGDTQVINVIRSQHDALAFRKEVAMHPSGLIELTVKADYASYTDNARGYSFFVPLKTLAGAKFQALVGRASSTKVVEGNIIPTNMLDGKSITGPGRDALVRCIAFESDTVKIVFDGNPYGPLQMYADFSSHVPEPQGCWSVYKSGDALVFTTMRRSASSYGGLHAAKMLIYEGVFDYDTKHPYQKWTYKGGPNPIIDIAFGSPRPPEGFVAADLARYTNKKAMGWEKPTTGTLTMTTSDDPTNIFANCVGAPEGGDNAFLINAKPGYYVITTQVGHPEHDIGPFDIHYGDKLTANGVTVPAGAVKTIIASYYHRNQEQPVAIHFSGKRPWAACSIAMQIIIYPNEDYVFDRKLWVMDGLFEPDFHVQSVHAPDISDIQRKMPAPIAYCDERTPAQTVDAGIAHKIKVAKETLLPANAEAMAWQRTMRSSGWSIPGGCVAFEFNTPELGERRVKELKGNGFNTIDVTMLFWNLSYTERWDEGIAMLRMICEAAHRNGMKVIHHLDGPVILYQGTGLHYLTAHPEWLQRDIRYGRPTFSQMCLNNPFFREEFFKRLVRLTAETGVDGFMIDECAFSSKDYCGCPYCREKFTQDTGWILPVNPGSNVFQNYDSPVWVRWIKWRQRAVGDWWVEVRKRLNKVNPDICIMKYATHYGLYGRWAPTQFGADIIEDCRACDFIGTEIMSRNVFDCYRSIYSFRKLYAAVGDHFGNQIFGIVYHNNDLNFLYFGWAMNQMNRQVTSCNFLEGADIQRFMEWPHQIKSAMARSISDVGILFSVQTRDFSRKYGTFPDIQGYSEILSDAHIQHDFLLDEDMYFRKLAQYKLIILAAVSCMSAEQVDAVRRYVAEGGTLLVSGNTAIQDEDGFFTPNFQLADVMGVDYDTNNPVIAGPHLIRSNANRTTVTYPAASFRLMPRPGVGARIKVLAEIIDGNSNAVAPAIIINPYGKGKCISLACKLGEANWERENTAGGKWDFEKNQELADFLVKVVRLAANDAFDVNAISMPKQVLMSVCRQKEEKADYILVQLLNAAGAARLKKGDIVPSKKEGEPFPAIKQDLVFNIRATNMINGYIVSPDYLDKRLVTLEKSANGYTKVTVRKDDLKAYAIVYFELADAGK